MSIKPTQSQIAEALGIDPAMVTRYKARGMPIDSIESAQSWKLAHVRVRVGLPGKPSRSSPPIAPDASRAAAEKMMTSAAALLQSGGDLAPFVPALRTALAAVPKDERVGMLFHPNVMDVLTADVAAQVSDDSAGDENPGANLSDDEAQRMGAFWYAVAAGEIRLAEGG
jgi:hypothetical protein